ncbi:MAG: ParA family protein, partial [Pseudomonadota bacterium]|nr:ParA family protein [Pseudomonadota bacterium]
ISTLSENVFSAADGIVVPVIPTTLSQRTYVQLEQFFQANKLPLKKLHAFFSMTQGVKSLHGQTMEEMRKQHKKRFLKTQIAFTSDIERMGVQRAPVMATAPRSQAAQTYGTLHDELMERL